MALIECPTCGKHSLEENKYCMFCGGLLDPHALKAQEELELKEKQAAEEQRKQIIEQQEEQQKQDILDMNAQYEYKVIKISDNKDGDISSDLIEMNLNIMAQSGWRLVNSFSNEIGKNAESFGFGGVSVGSNATVGEVVLIFERCIKLAKTK